MGFAPDGYYSFERLDGDGFNGLVRVSGDCVVFECVHHAPWAEWACLPDMRVQRSALPT